jgi:hypothetical protein
MLSFELLYSEPERILRKMFGASIELCKVWGFHGCDWRMPSSGMLRLVVLKRATRRIIPENCILHIIDSDHNPLQWHFCGLTESLRLVHKVSRLM